MDFVSGLESVCCVDVEVVVIVSVLPAVVIVDFDSLGEVDCCKIFEVVDV